MLVRDVARILEAEVLSGEDKLDRDVICGGAADMMSDILALCRPNQLVLTGYIYPQVIRTALVSELLGLVVVRGKNVPPETVKMARENDFLLLRTKMYMYSACGKLYAAGLRSVDGR
jgi:predicted transcriptional regulator